MFVKLLGPGCRLQADAPLQGLASVSEYLSISEELALLFDCHSSDYAEYLAGPSPGQDLYMSQTPYSCLTGPLFLFGASETEPRSGMC